MLDGGIVSAQHQRELLGANKLSHRYSTLISLLMLNCGYLGPCSEGVMLASGLGVADCQGEPECSGLTHQLLCPLHLTNSTIRIGSDSCSTILPPWSLHSPSTIVVRRKISSWLAFPSIDPSPLRTQQCHPSFAPFPSSTQGRKVLRLSRSCESASHCLRKTPTFRMPPTLAPAPHSMRNGPVSS